MGRFGLRHEYVEAGDLAARPCSWWTTVLGVVGFDDIPRVGGSSIPVAASMTPSLSAADGLCEVWRVADYGERGPTDIGHGDGRLLDGRLGEARVRYRYSEDLLFGSMIVDEKASSVSAAALVRATEEAYGEIFDVLEATGHHLLRVWNYLPEINRAAAGEERYRHFNTARRNTFQARGRTLIGAVPAASALGSPAGSPVVIYFIASRRAPTMIENPRQTSAYHYPRKFGVHSPIFSRACMLSESAGTNLFVSGTASILGHESMHPGDVGAQTHETMANIAALLEEANRIDGAARYRLDGLKFKVYVRQADDLEVIENALAATLRPLTPIVYLQADVCREDLLVEIEATGESAHG